MSNCFSSSSSAAPLPPPPQYQQIQPPVPVSAPPTPQTLLLRPSPQNSDYILVHPDGYPIEAPPMFTIFNNEKGKPHVTVSRGYMSQENIIGMVTFHFFSSTTNISVRGQSIPMKESMMGNYTLNLPNMGQFKWKPNPLTGSSPELFDQAGQKLAKLSSMGIKKMGQKKLEIYVPSGDYFLDFIVVTAFSVRQNLKTNREIGVEVTGAVLGV